MPPWRKVTEQRIRPEDGRRLGCAEYGVPEGRPLFLCHGIPGSRRLRHPDAAIAVELHLRLIVSDRPGIGLSDYKPGFTIPDWPADLLGLADALGIERFALEEIEVRTFLWQGEEDVIVTPAMGRFIAARLPNCAARFLPGEGHLLLFTRWREILKVLAASR